MACRVTFFYEDKGKGIQETWFNQASPDTVRNGFAQEYLEKRLAFADDQMVATYVRLAEATQKNRVEFMSLKNLAGFAGKIEEDGASPTDAILLRWLGMENEPGRMFLHCFPASFLKEDVVVPKGKWQNKLDAWISYMQSPLNQWRLRPTTGNIVANRRPIIDLIPQSPRGFKITTDSVVGLVAGDLVHVGRTGGDMVGAQGRKVVQSVDSVSPVKSFIVGGAKPVGSAAEGAYWVKLTQGSVAIKRGEAVRLTKHNVGAPFALPVGRQAATLSLRR